MKQLSESIPINEWLENNNNNNNNSTTKLKKKKKKKKRGNKINKRPRWGLGWELIKQPLACEAETKPLRHCKKTPKKQQQQTNKNNNNNNKKTKNKKQNKKTTTTTTTTKKKKKKKKKKILISNFPNQLSEKSEKPKQIYTNLTSKF